MKAVLILVTVAIVLTFLGGIGWVSSAVAEADGARIVFQWVLMVATGVTFLSLSVAVVVGVYHLYLYLFTAKKPVSLFETVPKIDPDTVGGEK